MGQTVGPGGLKILQMVAQVQTQLLFFTKSSWISSLQGQTGGRSSYCTVALVEEIGAAVHPNPWARGLDLEL